MRFVHLRRRSCPSQGRFRGLLDKRGRGRRPIRPLACGMLAAICRRESSVLAKASAEPCGVAGFCLGSPDRPPMHGLVARLVCRYAREAVRSVGFAKAREGRHPAELPAASRCRSGFCGDVARAARSGASRATAPRRLSGHAPGGVPGGGGGERSPWPPRRVRARRGGSGSRCAGGHGRSPDNAQRRALPGRLVGWRVGDARDLTRSRGFAVADPGGRLHLPASVVEVHVAARRLRGIVPLGIRPNGTIPFRGERPSSDSTRPFELSPGVFIMRKAVAAIRWRNTLSAVLSAIQKPAVQANNPAYRRLWCFFVLTKGMSVVGPRPALPKEVEKYTLRQAKRLSIRGGLTCYWQTRRNRDAISFGDGGLSHGLVFALVCERGRFLPIFMP